MLASLIVVVVNKSFNCAIKVGGLFQRVHKQGNQVFLVVKKIN